MVQYLDKGSGRGLGLRIKDQDLHHTTKGRVSQDQDSRGLRKRRGFMAISPSDPIGRALEEPLGDFKEALN